MGRKALQILEFTILFFGIPLLIYLDKEFIHPSIIILPSGISFSFLHIVYYDPVSMILSFIGGIYFARVYQQTRSVLFCTVLHGVMGIVIFGVGLGRYFWLDMPV